MEGATSEPRATGGCLCGAVRYAVHGALRDVVVCHCGRCRRTHGGAAPYAACAATDLVVEARDELRWHREEGRARGFCARCGARLFWRAAERDTISIAAGTLDGPTGLRTSAHIFTADAADYEAGEHEAPRHPGPLP